MGILSNNDQAATSSAPDCADPEQMPSDHGTVCHPRSLLLIVGPSQIDDWVDDDFAAYVSAKQLRLLRAAAFAGCSATEAEDAVQTALVNCYVSWRRVRAAADPDAYVYKVLFNTIKKSRRRYWWRESVTGTDGSAEGGVARSDAVNTLTYSVLNDALHSLSYEQRAVLVLRFYLDLSEAETARVLQVPRGTVKSRTSRGLERLASDPDVLDLTR